MVRRAPSSTEPICHPCHFEAFHLYILPPHAQRRQWRKAISDSNFSLLVQPNACWGWLKCEAWLKAWVVLGTGTKNLGLQGVGWAKRPQGKLSQKWIISMSLAPTHT